MTGRKRDFAPNLRWIGPLKATGILLSLAAGLFVYVADGSPRLAIISAAASLSLVGVAAAATEAIRRWRRRIRRRRRQQARVESGRVAEGLGRKLRVGFVSLSRERLLDLARDDNARASERGRACYELALVESGAGNYRAAHAWLMRALQSDPTSIRADEQRLILTDCLRELGLVEQARAELLQNFGADVRVPDVLLRLGNTYPPIAEHGPTRLDFLNEVYSSNGLPLVAGTGRPTLLDSLTTLCEPGSMKGPLVSVIVPARNAERTLETAVRSILAQSWRDLEVVVVDDCSDDGTLQVAATFMEGDSRVRVLHQEQRRGTYAARNLALSSVRGDFITVHDADDWSHGCKISEQIGPLLRDPSLQGTLSRLAQTDDDLTARVRPPRELRRGVVTPNASSLLVRRHVFQEVGVWDDVVAAADTEFLERLKHFYHSQVIREVHPDIPLSLCRNGSDTLTSSPQIGVRSAVSAIGPRRLYSQAYRRWHGSGGFEDYLPYVPSQDQRRPFAAPQELLRASNSGQKFDVVILTDLSLTGGTISSTLEEVRAQSRAGMRTGLVHNPIFSWRSATADINPKVWDVVDGNSVVMLSGWSDVSCGHLVIRSPKVLESLLDDLPHIQADEVSVIVNQAPQHYYTGGSPVLYDLSVCSKQAEETFGPGVIWRPIGPVVREALLRYHASELSSLVLSDEDWVSVIDVSAWSTGRRRGAMQAEGRPIRIGRHARDSPEKWPERPDDLLGAYPNDESFDVRHLGGAEVPSRIIGSLPANWTVYEFDEITPREFLSELDVFVYFTHSGLMEAFGRSVLEAMASGVPVVTMRRLQPLFGKAAIYCAPRDLAESVISLVSDPERYSQQSFFGMNAVRERFGYFAHVARLRSQSP